MNALTCSKSDVYPRNRKVLLVDDCNFVDRVSWTIGCSGNWLWVVNLNTNQELDQNPCDWLRIIIKQLLTILSLGYSTVIILTTQFKSFSSVFITLGLIVLEV